MSGQWPLSGAGLPEELDAPAVGLCLLCRLTDPVLARQPLPREQLSQEGLGLAVDCSSAPGVSAARVALPVVWPPHTSPSSNSEDASGENSYFHQPV